jgi:hypothetical protein
MGPQNTSEEHTCGVAEVCEMAETKDTTYLRAAVSKNERFTTYDRNS